MCQCAIVKRACCDVPHFQSLRPTCPESSQRGHEVPPCAGLFSYADCSDSCTNSATWWLMSARNVLGRLGNVDCSLAVMTCLACDTVSPRISLCLLGSAVLSVTSSLSEPCSLVSLLLSSSVNCFAQLSPSSFQGLQHFAMLHQMSSSLHFTLTSYSASLACLSNFSATSYFRTQRGKRDRLCLVKTLDAMLLAVIFTLFCLE